ncbi:MAG: AbrB/MazE/SpoVT family DNA-binding domain-containing protein [Chloroflexi bacterium]|nr:AbrB/MazE/SpoVT family DNA-binding domain-containing protein [Chloroflexota bacterium]
MLVYTELWCEVTRTAKLFKNGRSQAVRLPADFRFDATEVFVRRDPLTGDVILSQRPPNWGGFFAALAGVDVRAGFLVDHERDQGDDERDPFAGWRD